MFHESTVGAALHTQFFKNYCKQEDKRVDHYVYYIEEATQGVTLATETFP